MFGFIAVLAGVAAITALVHAGTKIAERFQTFKAQVRTDLAIADLRRWQANADAIAVRAQQEARERGAK